MRRGAVVALVLVTLGAVAEASPRVAVVGNDDGVTDAVRAALGPDVELVAVSGDTADVVALARAHQLDALVDVDVSGSRSRSRAVVTAWQGGDGVKLARYVVKARRRKLAAKTAAVALHELRGALATAQRPAVVPAEEPLTASVPTPAPPGPARSATVGEAPVTGAMRAAAPHGAGATSLMARSAAHSPRLELSVDGRAFMRRIRYRDDLNMQLRAHDLEAPAAGIAATLRLAGRFSVRAELELVIGLQGSETSDGTSYETSASEWSAGVHGAWPIAGTQLGVHAGYGEQRCAVGGDLIPDVTYRWLGVGVALRVPFGSRLALEGGAGWRQLVDAGELGSAAWFPRVSGAGVDVDLGVRWQATDAIALSAGGDLRRYFLAMNPEPGDPWIAGGALDQYLAVVARLSVAIR